MQAYNFPLSIFFPLFFANSMSYQMIENHRYLLLIVNLYSIGETIIEYLLIVKVLLRERLCLFLFVDFIFHILTKN